MVGSTIEQRRDAKLRSDDIPKYDVTEIELLKATNRKLDKLTVGCFQTEAVVDRRSIN